MTVFQSCRLTQDAATLDRLVTASLLGMGSQKNAKGVVGTPTETVMLALIDPAHTIHKHTCREGEKMTVWLALAHDSVRQRKKLIRGSNATTQRIEMHLFTERFLGLTIPEVPRKHYAGYSHGDCVGFITAVAPQQLWRLPRAEKEDVLGSRKVTVSQADKNQDPQDEFESVFSCSTLPVEFYQELLHSSCAKSCLDLSPAQGDLCKAALLNRVRLAAVCGTEKHAQKLELALTDFISQELVREGSTFYRAEACSAKDGEKDGEGEGEAGSKKRKGKGGEAETDGKKPKKAGSSISNPTSKPKSGSQDKTKKNGGDDNRGEIKTKKLKKTDAEEQAED